ncbi:MAG: hypothetical protein BWX83_00871 [Candidatus Cloacimonetes bacterium ADurb.Bin117]|nr:MAG: hypothetical protein BWX83_00871 [Candidatus Cloacimonetes bacterium ADurb.Bin117]
MLIIVHIRPGQAVSASARTGGDIICTEIGIEKLAHHTVVGMGVGVSSPAIRGHENVARSNDRASIQPVHQRHAEAVGTATLAAGYGIDEHGLILVWDAPGGVFLPVINVIREVEGVELLGVVRHFIALVILVSRDRQQHCGPRAGQDFETEAFARRTGRQGRFVVQLITGAEIVAQFTAQRDLRQRVAIGGALNRCRIQALPTVAVIEPQNAFADGGKIYHVGCELRILVESVARLVMADHRRLGVIGVEEAQRQSVVQQIPGWFDTYIGAVLNNFAQIDQADVGTRVLDGHSGAKPVGVRHIARGLARLGGVILHHDLTVFMQDHLKLEAGAAACSNIESEVVPLDNGITFRSVAEGLEINVGNALLGKEVIPINSDQARHLGVSGNGIHIVEYVAVVVPALAWIGIVPGIVSQQNFAVDVHIGLRVLVTIEGKGKSKRDGFAEVVVTGKSGNLIHDAGSAGGADVLPVVNRTAGRVAVYVAVAKGVRPALCDALHHCEAKNQCVVARVAVGIGDLESDAVIALRGDGAGLGEADLSAGVRRQVDVLESLAAPDRGAV